MWKDEFLPSIRGEIEDKAARNQASIRCPEDVTTSRSLKNLYPLIIRLLCQLTKGQTAKIDKKYKDVTDVRVSRSEERKTSWLPTNSRRL